jgi:hypothetical protein
MKKFIIIGGITLIILAILGVVLFSIYSPKPTSYFVNKALEKNDASVCLEVENTPSKAKYPMDCWRGIANRIDNVQICQAIVQEVEKYNCYTAFIHTRWENFQEVLCDKLDESEDKNFCFKVTAIAKNDPVFCENIDTSVPTYSTGVADCQRDVVQQNQ